MPGSMPLMTACFHSVFAFLFTPHIADSCSARESAEGEAHL
jgi:hypothetical protein